MYSDHIQPQLLPLTPPDPTSPAVSFIALKTTYINDFLKNSLTLICALYVFLGVGPSTRAWSTYQEPHP